MTQHIRPFCFLVLMFLAFSAMGEGTKTDSLFTSISTEPNDTLRFRKMYDLTIKMFEDESGPSVANSALPFLEKMLSDAKNRKDSWWIAKAHQALATLYFMNNAQSKGHIHLIEAMKEWVRVSHFSGIAELKYLEGRMLIVLDKPERIQKLFVEAIALCRQHGLNSLEVKITGFEASYYLFKKEYAKSARKFEDWFRIPNRPEFLQAYYYTNLATAYKNLKLFHKADSCSDLALAMAQKLKQTDLAATIIFNRACVAYDQKQFDLSEKYALESKPLILKGDELVYKMNMYGLLMDIYNAKKNYQKAFEYSELYFHFHDSLATRDKQSEFNELDKKYQTEIKNKTITDQKNRLEQEGREKKYLQGGIGALLVISVLAGFLFYTNRKRKELKLNQNIAESEMKALRAQMNPHFMFNSLNAIQQMVMNNENDNAFRYLDTYSKLTRQILENSEKKWITVKDEMKFLELYLEIESLRFEHAFRYKIEASDEVMPNSDRIPAMVVQPIVENAIKHGLLRKDGDKNLLIRFDRKDDHSPLEVVVEDNGLGRVATLQEKKESDHHSMSLGITENRLQLLDASGGSRMEVEDLHSPDGKPTGTRVHIYISQNAS